MDGSLARMLLFAVGAGFALRELRAAAGPDTPREAVARALARGTAACALVGVALGSLAVAATQLAIFLPGALVLLGRARPAPDAGGEAPDAGPRAARPWVVLVALALGARVLALPGAPGLPGLGLLVAIALVGLGLDGALSGERDGWRRAVALAVALDGVLLVLGVALADAGRAGLTTAVGASALAVATMATLEPPARPRAALTLPALVGALYLILGLGP